MENPGSIPRDQQCASSETKFAIHTRQGTKLRDILKCDKPVKTSLSYADFDHNIARTPDVTLPKYVGSQQSRVLDSRVSKEDELVRYMSNLPSYLEKGKNYQDKALNVGVLDWRRLEKWQCSQKQMPGQQNGCSPSSSSSSFFSTDGSPAHSSGGLSCSPTRQRVHRLSLQSTVEESPKEAHVQDAIPSSGRGHSYSPTQQKMQLPVPHHHSQKVRPGGRTSDIGVFSRIPQKFQDSPVSIGNNFSRQQRVLGAVQFERKDSDLKSVSEMGKRQTLDKYEVGAPWKGKSKTQGMESAKETIRSQETKFGAANLDFSSREKSGDVFMPRDLSNLKCSSLTDISSFTADGRLSVDPCQKSILVRNSREADVSSKNDHKKQLEPSESSSHANCIKSSSQHSDLPLHTAPIAHTSRKKNAQGVRGAPQASHMLSFPARILSSPYRCRNAEEKRPAAVSKSEIAVQVSEEVAARRSSASIPKARNPSPIQRLGTAMGKMIKNTGSRENSPVRRSSSKEPATKYGSEREISLASVSNPYCDKLSTNNNRRPSPLRRLLDPLLKPRASTCSEPSRKHSSSINGTINSCNEPMDLCVNSSTASDSTTLLQAQALLQVSFKNGLPLFTFAIDNESNILAATVRKSSVPGKGHHSWTYTFFTIREKKRGGIWLSQGGKGDGHGYVPNVVAQMKVSDSWSSSTKLDNAGHNVTREFDLFAVDGDQYANDFHPTNELAAIVVKLPSTAEPENDTKDVESGYKWLDAAQDCCDNVQEMRSSNSSAHSFKSPNFSSTVILPGGVHTVPSKGEISTLAERWRSGGSCDCGGWDLGCQLRVYTNKKEHERRISSSGTVLNKDKFQLFSQGNQDGQSILSLSPYKERIYSVEFSSSLSLLQAFAICMSFIDCRRPPELPEPSVVVEKIADACIFDVAILAKTTSQGEAPGNFVSNPPHSPVGRV